MVVPMYEAITGRRAPGKRCASVVLDKVDVT